ncbi:hypothetical protein ISN45_Aa06g011420 [Arabidopsis thaliana x Arabidopsis arenosa]|uniref:Uncharacterized protein n=1 Tax=Arabidopsis thaliana x Arabidopsis arenosa TaxID=1240361 RepID=A0A8T1YV66_9BRAS|nr:hypothetical protein ISN45_Aa06g011420 [Arabidopsis thaliana x Arabidopsis arenosa]
MQPPICKPRPQSHLEFLKPLLNDSIKQLLIQYRSGRTNFSDFDSIFTRILNDLPEPPPLELVWFYSATRFFSSKLAFRDDSVRLTSSFFQLLVSFSDSFSGVKKVALLSPVVYQLSRLVNSRRRDALSLLEGIVSYISMYCVEEPGDDDDDVLMVSGFSFGDLSRVWVVDEVEDNCRVEDCLEIFMPFVSETLRKEMDSESCRVGYLAGIVASQVFLLSLCSRFDLELSRSELEKDLRESVLQMISGFHCCYFFDVILKMLLLEPYLHLTSLLGPEDEAILTEIITEAVMKSAEKLFLNPGNGASQRSLHLENIAIKWLFLFDKTMASLRRNKDQEKTSRYMSMFTNSRIPYHLINWVISQGEVIRDADALRNLTPTSFIEWLVSLEEQGLRVFNCDHSKNYARTVIHRLRPDLSLGATLLKQQEEFDQDADMADDYTVSSISILSSNTRKRKEERHNKEGETKVKLFKHRHSNLQENSKFQPFVFSDGLVKGTEVEVSDMEL